LVYDKFKARTLTFKLLSHLIIGLNHTIMQVTIIGAGTGISRAVAHLFGSKGFKVALVARNEDKLKAEVETLISQGIQAMYAVGDVSNEASLYSALDIILATYGHSDMLLYNPSSSIYKGLEDETWESLVAQLNINVGGAFHLLKRVLPYFKKENKGKLFFTGGGLSLHPQPNLTGLSMGKAALRNLVQGAAASVSGTNIHIAIVTVCGFVNESDPKYNPNAIAQHYWNLFKQKEGAFETEIIY